MLTGFRDFLLRGNVVDLATAVVIGAAFNQVVDGFIKAFVDPLLAIILGGSGQALSAVVIGPFPVGLFLSAVLTFILQAAVVYFFIVRPFRNLAARSAAAPPPAGPPPADVQLLTEIRDLLKERR